MLPSMIAAIVFPRTPHSIIGANKKAILTGHTFLPLGLHEWEQKLFINDKVRPVLCML